MAFPIVTSMKSDTVSVPLHTLQVGGVVQSKRPRRRSKDRLQMSKLTSSLRSSSFHGRMGASNRSGMALMTEGFEEEGGKAPSLLRNSSWSAGGGLLTRSCPQRGGHMASIEDMINIASNDIKSKEASSQSQRQMMMMHSSSIRGLLGSSQQSSGREIEGPSEKDPSSFRRQVMMHKASIRGLL
jgi:hypothetical protein